jgi:hypothetical protein
MVQMVVVAGSRRSVRRARAAAALRAVARRAFGLCAVLPMLETGPWPLGRYEIRTSPHLRELAQDPSVHS